MVKRRKVNKNKVANNHLQYFGRKIVLDDRAVERILDETATVVNDMLKAGASAAQLRENGHRTVSISICENAGDYIARYRVIVMMCGVADFYDLMPTHSRAFKNCENSQMEMEIAAFSAKYSFCYDATVACYTYVTKNCLVALPGQSDDVKNIILKEIRHHFSLKSYRGDVICAKNADGTYAVR